MPNKPKVHSPIPRLWNTKVGLPANSGGHVAETVSKTTLELPLKFSGRFDGDVYNPKNKVIEFVNSLASGNSLKRITRAIAWEAVAIKRTANKISHSSNSFD